MGYGEKTVEQCKNKIKNLTAKYRKVKDKLKKSGNEGDNTFPYFDDMDAVLGTRAATNPPRVVDSGVIQSEFILPYLMKYYAISGLYITYFYQ